MKGNPQLYNISALPDSYYRYFEVALGYFMTDGLTPGYWTNYDFQTYSQLVGGEKDPSAVTSGANLQGRLNNILRSTQRRRQPWERVAGGGGWD